MTLIDSTTNAAADAPAAPHLWLPGHALNCYEGNTELRSWLLTPGLLTQRVREASAGAFAMNVLSERSEAGDHVREIELCCAGRAWIYAQTRVPASTLAAEPWLGGIGHTPLGEALAAHGAVRRSDFEYARLYDDVDVVREALARRGLPPQPLWVRRSTFALGPHTLTLREVFLPDVGRPAA
jgi:chorismate--pyruvate lyase